MMELEPQDVGKLKVTELRAELSARGLDTKGVKAILAQRLLEYLAKESGVEQEPQAVLDTSTEEVSDSERRDSKDSDEPDSDPLKQNEESSPEPDSVAPSVVVEPPTSEKDMSEVEEDGSPHNAIEDSNSSLSNNAYQQEDSGDYQQDNVSSDAVQADYQMEDSTNTNDFQQSDSNVSSDFTKDKHGIFEEHNSVEFQQGDNANQQWTNQEEFNTAPVSAPAAKEESEPMEAETTLNGHIQQDEVSSAEIKEPAEDKMDTEDAEVKKDEEDTGRAKRRRDRKNRWGPSEPEEQTPDKRRKTSESEEKNDSHEQREDDERTRERDRSPEVQKPAQVEKPENEPEIDPEAYTLAWYDSDLNLEIDTDSFTSASPMSDQGFVYMWAGARSTFGFNKGKIYFEVNLKEYCDTSNYKADIFPHQLRVGLSLKSCPLQLGEAPNSFGFESTGKIVNNNEYSLFGKPANVEDIIGMYVDFESDKEYILVRFSLNGEEIKLVRRQVREVPDEFEDVEIEEVVTDDEPEEGDDEEKKEEVNEKEEKKEESDEQGEKVEEKSETSEDKMEGIEEVKKEETPKEPAPKPKRTKIIKKTVQKKIEKAVEYDYLPEETGDEIAFKIPKSDIGEEALFPHVLTKNIKYEINFGGKEEPWHIPSEGFIFPVQLASDEKIGGHVRPNSRADCEMLMMCGLPGAGKTTWVNEHLKNNADKLYNVFGTFSLINKMKINSEPLKDHVKRWYHVVEDTTKCLNRLLELGWSRRRNFILDQTNVYISAQRRKMRNYFGFKRRAIVVIPTDEEYIRRLQEHREKEGKDDVPPDPVILEMKANFRLPEEGSLFEEVTYIELQKEEADKIIEQYNQEGKDAGFGQRYSDRMGGGYNGRGGRRDRDREFRRNRGGGGGGFGYGRGGGGMERRMGGGDMWVSPRDRRLGGGRWGDRDDSRWGGRDDRGPRGPGGFGRGGGFGGGRRDDRDRMDRGESFDSSTASATVEASGGEEDAAAPGTGGSRDGGRWGRGGRDEGRRNRGGSGRDDRGPRRSGFGNDRSGGGYGGNRYGGDRGDRYGHRSGFANRDRNDKDNKGGKGSWGNQQGGWGNQASNNQSGWANQGNQNQWQTWQNWNQWSQQWNQAAAAQQWAGYGGTQNQSTTGTSNTNTSATQNQQSQHSTASNAALANTASNTAATAASSTAAAAATSQYPQSYNAQAYAGYNTANYSGWTAQQYQQYYAAQGWTQNADGSYNYPQNWNAQNWQGYGYSTTGQTGSGASAGQTAGQTSQGGVSK